MLRIHLKELIAEKEFQENRRVTIMEISEQTGINRMTLSKIINHRGHNIVTDNLDRLCAYFGCPIEKLVTYIEDTDQPDPQR